MKPVVLYDSTKHTDIVLNRGAIVYPFNHPSDMVSNTRYALTTKVIRVGENGEFETMNTIYRPK